MLTREQATVIADAIHRLRPRWTTDELMTVLGDTRIRDHRNMRDTASALAWLALDVSTQAPTRLFAPGQWWRNATAEDHVGPVAPVYRPLAHDDCHECGMPPTAHPTRLCPGYVEPVRKQAPMPEAIRDEIRKPALEPEDQEQASMTQPLFEGYDPPPPPASSDPGPSADRRRTLRQAETIAAGRHPLTKGPLHELADLDATSADGQSLPYRCGSCYFRQITDNPFVAGKYPKCFRHGAPISGGAATDVRAWWPACEHYSAGDPRLSPDAARSVPTTAPTQGEPA